MPSFTGQLLSGFLMKGTDKMTNYQIIQPLSNILPELCENLANNTIWYEPKEDYYVIVEQAFDKKKQLCFWYSGEVATIIKDGYAFKISAIGKVEATYEYGNIYRHLVDTKGTGKFKDYFSDIFKDEFDVTSSMSMRRMKFNTSTWVVDVWKMKPCDNMHFKITNHLFPLTQYLDECVGSYEWKTLYFSDVLSEIVRNTDDYASIYS